MVLASLPLTYDECRARFRWWCAKAGLEVEPHPIDARGPEGQQLTIDVTQVGATSPERALIVMSGVHGVEGYIGSAMQCELIDRLVPQALPDGFAVLLLHAVNPWGMAWWRRQNESNVDLNRNWNRDHVTPPPNPGYDELHPFLCPDSPELPTPESFLDRSRVLLEERGMPWMQAAVSGGQYTHADGLYFGGDRTEQSTRIVASVVAERLGAVGQSLCVDLHTGHGAPGTYTILLDAPPGSEPHNWLSERFDADRIEATVGNPHATTAHKVGQIGHGLADVLPESVHRSITLELGTVSDTRMILSGRSENWVHHHGDRTAPAGVDALWANRRCYTPDDPAWADHALAHGRVVLDAAVRSAAGHEPLLASDT
jgi:hypothetical protein